MCPSIYRICRSLIPLGTDPLKSPKAGELVNYAIAEHIENAGGCWVDLIP